MASILKAVKLSPSGFFGRLKHKKLPEEWGDGIKEPVLDGITFYVKYLGSTLVGEPNDQQSTADAIKTIISMAKASGKKLQRIAMSVNPKGILLVDITSGETYQEFSIYRISYCSADATYDRVVAFIATNANETLECHAFLCSKRKVAQAAALTISQAFNIAFDLWQCCKRVDSADDDPSCVHRESDGTNDGRSDDLTSGYKSSNSSGSDRGSQCALIDLSMEGDSARETMRKLGFEMDQNLNDSFSKLAEARSYPIFSTNLKAEEIEDLTHYVCTQEEKATDREHFLRDPVDDLLLL